MEGYEVEANGMRHALPDKVAHVHADYYTEHDYEKFLSLLLLASWVSSGCVKVSRG